MSAKQSSEDALWTRLGALAEDGISRLEGSPLDPVFVTGPARLAPVLTALRDDGGLAFTRLIDLTAIDRSPSEPRFELSYLLESPDYAPRLRVRSPVGGSDAPLASAASLHPAAEWLEREIQELFGLSFTGLGSDAGLLLPAGSTRWPLRKDAAPGSPAGEAGP